MDALKVMSDQTIMAIAGHVSRKMLEHYSHIRTEAKRAALDAIAKPPDGYVQAPATGNMDVGEANSHALN